MENTNSSNLSKTKSIDDMTDREIQEFLNRVSRDLAAAINAANREANTNCGGS